MLRQIALAVCVLLFCAAPAMAGTFQIWEDSLGSPGVTAQFPLGSGQIADIDFDAGSAEDGGLLLGGPSEVGIHPTGSVVFVAFICQLAGCTEGLGRVTVDGAFTWFADPDGSHPFALTPGADGALWFTDSDANKIGRVTTSGAFTTFAIPTPDSLPHGIVTGPNGDLWFSEVSGNKIGVLRR